MIIKNNIKEIILNLFSMLEMNLKGAKNTYSFYQDIRESDVFKTLHILKQRDLKNIS